MSLSPLLLALAVAVAPAPAVTVAPAPISTVADTLVDVGGHRLHLEIHRGTAPLTVVFEAGGGADLSSWGTVVDSLADRTDATVVAYDRAGLGQSELGPPDLDARDEVADLRRALESVGAPAPTIVAAHSYGGLLALLHAAEYPNAIVGLVLVDPMNPRFVEATGDFLDSTVPDIPDPRTDQEKALVRMIDGFDDLVDDLGAIEPRLEVPITVLTAGEPWWGEEAIDAAWLASHRAMAAAAPNRDHLVVPETDHDIPTERGEVVVERVVEMIERVSGSSD